MPEIREAARQRVVDAVNDDTQLLIGHSLGSVVAYEALAAHPEWSVEGFVSLGSPLGVRVGLRPVGAYAARGGRRLARIDTILGEHR